MANLSYAQLRALAIQAGFPAALAPLMAAIALAESGGNPDAVNPTDNGGRQSSFGLWQISTGTHTPPSPNWNDPLTNAKLAYQKWQTQGLGAWGTYTSGAYKKYYGSNSIAGDAASSVGSGIASGVQQVTQAAGSVTSGASNVLDALQNFWNALGPWLSNPLRTLKLVVGVILLIVVLFAALSETDIGQATIKTSKQVATKVGMLAA